MLDFSKAKEGIIIENSFDETALGKVEALFCLGNGYLGLRSCLEEKYINETRDLFVAGTYNLFHEEKAEVTELPNAADITNIEIYLDGERFDLTKGRIVKYERAINLKTGLLTRDVTWISNNGKEYSFKFERIVSLKRIHTIAMRISITSKDNVKVKITSGINGRVTNTGAAHFTYGDARFYEKKYMQYAPKTTERDIMFVFNVSHNFYTDNKKITPQSDINIKRRYMFSNFEIDLEKDKTLTLEKHIDLYTSLDKELEGKEKEELLAFGLNSIKETEKFSFEELYNESAKYWKEKVWDRASVEIKGDDFDNFALMFAQYHMMIMAPAHDNRMSIGAKGFTGEGYKGHVFWDTEIFLLPYYTFNMPEIAKSLEEYRYHSLEGAHKKAKSNNLEGAQYPWESAWINDGEVTSLYKGTDVVTGKLIKVWTGIIEIHITSDVAFGVWSYYKCTSDQKFMDDMGYEIIFDCAKFWLSRLEKGEDNLYHINDVVGPDEYKEHVDDNAYTNYLAKWTIDKAYNYAVYLKTNKEDIYNRLNEKLSLDNLIEKWNNILPLIYLTKPNENKVLPQDTTYLSLKEIDLDKYKKQPFVGGIYKDYNQEQITKIQVSKQADVMVLFLLLEDMFSKDVKVNSFNYYEPHCLHDSSLSLCTHSILAADIGKIDLAYDLFKKSLLIDLDNNNMHSSDEGIHAASCGGIWQSVVQGFGGLRMLNGNLRVSPNMPKKWESLIYTFYWKNQRIKVEATKDKISLELVEGSLPVELEVWQNKYTLIDKLEINR